MMMTSGLFFANLIFAAPIAIYVLGVLLLPVAIVALALEYFVIILIQPSSYSKPRVLINFLFVNFVSTLVGVALASLPGLPTGYRPEGVDPMDNNTWRSIAVSSALILGSLSMLCEALLYRYVHLLGGIEWPWRSSILGNFASYGILILLMLVPLLNK
jgi:hypothetical protein